MASHSDEATDFHDKKIIRQTYMTNAYLAVISLDSALKKDDNYYRQVFLKECNISRKK